MILHEKLLENTGKTYEETAIRTKVPMKCDYCEKEFERVKKSIPRLNKKINKDSCGEKECTNKKKEDICMKEKGYKHQFADPVMQEKIKQTNKEKYHNETYFSSEDFQIKRKKTLNDTLGVDSPLQHPSVREKHRKTCLDKYQKDNYAKTKEFKEKIAIFWEKRCGSGITWIFQSPEIKEQIKKTHEEKYGGHYTKTIEYWAKRIQTCIDRYGVEHPSQLKSNRDQAKETCKAKYGVDHYSQLPEHQEELRKYFLETYGVPNPLCLKQNQKYGKTQHELCEWINSLGCNFTENDYSVLKHQELDLYDKDLGLAVEVCGLFWHNDQSLTPKTRDYHYNKYRKCLDKNIRLITIFGDELKNKQEQCKGIIKSIVNKQKNLIYARKCSLEELDKKTFNEFCDKYHLQGSNNLGLVFFALKHNNEIVAGMSIGRHHRNNNVITIDRLCFKSDVNIIGGSSKLFSACKKWAIKNNHNKIISWSDNRWSQGNVYETIGFVLEAELPPDYTYVNKERPYERISKQSQMKSNTDCPTEITEKEWAEQHGLARIWDCGKKRWIYNL